MSTPPDVIGLEFDEARRRLEAAGLKISVAETRPPFAVELSGSLRVVRMRRRSGDTVELVVTRERYQPPGDSTPRRSR